jgi:hypothetical protein
MTWSCAWQGVFGADGKPQEKKLQRQMAKKWPSEEVAREARQNPISLPDHVFQKWLYECTIKWLMCDMAKRGHSGFRQLSIVCIGSSPPADWVRVHLTPHVGRTAL